MRRESFMKKIAVLAFLVSVMCIAVPVTAEAKAAANKLKIGQTYTKYDITGDKKADTIRVSGNWNGNYGGYVSYEVFVNGKSALKRKCQYGLAYDIVVRRLELKNGKTFLSIVPESENGDVPDAAVYQYKSGKMKKVINMDSMSKIGYHNSVGNVKVSGNKIRVQYWEMSYSLGSIGFWLDYQYKNGKLVQVTTQPRLTDTILKYQKKTYWTANRSMTVTKSPGGKKVTTLTKGKKVKIDKIYINTKHNKIYLHVKIKGGKSGWVKGLTKYPDKILFKEVMYAG